MKWFVCCAVTPNEYQPDFRIDPNTGIISVTAMLDREEIETITLQIQVELLHFFSFLQNNNGEANFIPRSLYLALISYIYN